jgi:GDSL-like Lipase/Acylhydrolase family
MGEVESVPEKMLERAVVSMGDTARLQHALAKARRGEKVVVSVIGGSITEGASADSVEARWGNRVAQWWRDTFPDAEIVFVNAGIGATGSDIGTFRAKAHLLSHNPDFVAAEFAVNDRGSAIAGETLEGLTRQILRQPNRPAVMLLFTMDVNGNNTQAQHEPVGRHYRLPMVSFRDGVWPDIVSGNLKWDDIEADTVHPNTRGHGMCADFVIAVLEKVLADLPNDDALPEPAAVPKPLMTDAFERVAMFNRDSLTPVRYEGWQPHKGGRMGPGWVADAPGSIIEFDVEGTVVALAFHRIKGDMGIAEAQVDDLPPVKMNAWFDADWGGYTPFELVAKNLKPGTHRLRVKLLDEKSEASNGHGFQIHAVFVGGRPL